MKCRCAVIVFGCIVACVQGQITGYDFVKPTPVLNLAEQVKSTDRSNSIRQNKIPVSTTGIFGIQPSADLVSPSPVIQVPTFTTTAARNLRDDDVASNKQFTTGVVDILPSEGIIQPTPVIQLFKTGVGIPNLNNDGASKPLLTTGVFEVEGSVIPTPVLNVPNILATQPAAVPLTNKDTKNNNEALASILGTSTEVSTTNEPTSNQPPTISTNAEDQEPTKVPDAEVTPDIPHAVPPCTCSDYEDSVPTPGLEYTSLSFGNPPPQYGVSKVNQYPHGGATFQHFIRLHINFFINNFPVLQANVQPMYEYYK